MCVRAGALCFGKDAACLPLVHGSRHSASRQVTVQCTPAVPSYHTLSTWRCNVHVICFAETDMEIGVDYCVPPFPWTPSGQGPSFAVMQDYRSSVRVIPYTPALTTLRPSPRQKAVALLAEWVAGTGRGGLCLRPRHPHDARSLRGAASPFCRSRFAGSAAETQVVQLPMASMVGNPRRRLAFRDLDAQLNNKRRAMDPNTHAAQHSMHARVAACNPPHNAGMPQLSWASAQPDGLRVRLGFFDIAELGELLREPCRAAGLACRYREAGGWHMVVITRGRGIDHRSV